jgi:hypothetical protein
MPFHLECESLEEDHLAQILAYMYRMKRFQALFGKSGFYYKTQGSTHQRGSAVLLQGFS